MIEYSWWYPYWLIEGIVDFVVQIPAYSAVKGCVSRDAGGTIVLPSATRT